MLLELRACLAGLCSVPELLCSRTPGWSNSAPEFLWCLARLVSTAPEKRFFECGKTFLPLFIECMFVEHDEAYVIVFAVNSSKEIKIFAQDTEK
jgi:hypothetical protein